MTNKIIFQMDGFPVQQNRVYNTVEDAISCPKGSIKLIQDRHTGLLYNSDFNPDLIIYDENYQNEQGYSPTFQKHLHDVLKIIKKHFKGKRLLEIGCGKGNFLELLKDNNFSVTGVDPAYEGPSTSVIKKIFSSELGIKGDAIILRHVLEHIPNPFLFLQSIAKSNDNQGLVYIEVPCFEWICNNRAWFDIYYEHVNYFRKIDFIRFFGKIIESGYLFGGQYLYVVADLATIRNYDTDTLVFDNLTLPSDFFNGIKQAVSLMQSHKGKNVVWGAASRGVIFAYHVYRYSGIKPDFIIDINPVKQGKFIPVTGLRVLKPEDAIEQLREKDAIYIVNSNYYKEIQTLAGDHFTYYLVDQYDV